MISRRAFLGLSSTALVATALTPRFRRSSHDSAHPESATAFSGTNIGYWLGDDVVPATRCAHGAPLAAREAWVTVHGVCDGGRSWIRPALQSIEVSLLLPGAPAPLRCSEWRLDRRDVQHRRAAAWMPAPIDPASGLGFSIQRTSQAPGMLSRMVRSMVLGRRATGAERWTGELWLGATADAAAPVLRAGTYFVACPDRPDRAPVWSRYQFQPLTDGGPRVLTRRGPEGLEPADFDYVVITVAELAASRDHA